MDDKTFVLVFNMPYLPEKEHRLNYAGLADRTIEELNGLKAYIFNADIEMMDKLDQIFTQSDKDFAEFKDSIRKEEDDTKLLLLLL
jgi:hypothetical protein